VSASYLVDLGNTTGPQFAATAGSFFPASGANVSNIVDMLNYNTFTNLLVGGIWQFPSGQLRIQVQTSDDTVSGNFTDPTSGLAAFPTVFQSGGQLFFNSGGGGSGGLFGLNTSGQSFFSGFIAAAGFQRPQRYARVVVPASGPNALEVGQLNGVIGFVSQLKTTGSGGGFTLAPSSGAINV